MLVIGMIYYTITYGESYPSDGPNSPVNVDFECMNDCKQALHEHMGLADRVRFITFGGGGQRYEVTRPREGKFKVQREGQQSSGFMAALRRCFCCGGPRDETAREIKEILNSASRPRTETQL